MKKISLFYRIIYIQYIFIKNGLDEVLTRHPKLFLLRFFVFLNPVHWFRTSKLERGEAIRVSLESLGPIFVKFGQALSTRPDLIPEDIALELSKLQDNVPPFSSHLVVKTLEKTYQKPINQVFADFDIKPLASASIAQVHAATLSTGERVVIKVLRPNIKKIIQKDVQILFVLASWVEKYLPHGKRFKPVEVVNEFKHHLLDELDFNREAANAAQLRRNFNKSPLLYIPEIYWNYTHEQVLVIERIDAIPVNDVKQLNTYGIDLKKLAERGLEIFFTQVFRDCFFHADMHPGNIFVSKQHPNEPQYICIDFGIVGTLNQTDQYYLAENLLAFFNRDYLKVATLHIASGWIPDNCRPEEFASAIRTVCEPIFEKPLKDISFGLLILRLFQVARRFHMVVQPQLILLQKTLLAVEGLGRQIYPDLDLWKTAKPFLQKWVKQQMGPKVFLEHCRENIPFVMKELPYMPKLINDVLLLTKNNYQQALKSQHVPTIEKSSHHFLLKSVMFLTFTTILSLLVYRLPEKIDKPLIVSFLLGAGLCGMLGIICQRKK